MSHRVHTLRTLVVAVLLGAAATLFVAQPASAHDELIGSTPAAGSSVEALPGELVLTFSGVLLAEPSATDVVVTDAAGTDLTAGDPTFDGTKLTQPLSETAPAPGTVTVIWRVVSSDGHPISGEFTFAVGGEAPVAPVGTETPLPGPPMEAADLTWIWWALAALVVGGGAVLLVARTRNRHPHED